MSKFKPCWYKKSVFDINYDLLKKQKIKVIIFDLDNTIAFIHEKSPSKEIIALFKKLNKIFDKIIIASNSPKRRVKNFGDELNCLYYANLVKPTKLIEKKLFKDLKLNKAEICLIGDQLMTDILLGNRIGVKTILVDPLGKKDFIVTSLNRYLEKKIFNKLGIKRGNYYEEE